MILGKRDQDQLVKLLSELKPGFLPQEIFLAITRLVVTPTIVLIPVRYLDSDPEVLLIERDERDEVYQGYWHTPGSVLMATDIDITSALERIAKTELEIEKLPAIPEPIGQVFVDIPRGKEISILYRVQGELKTSAGKWFKTNNLPDKIVPTDIPRIKAAAAK